MFAARKKGAKGMTIDAKKRGRSIIAPRALDRPQPGKERRDEKELADVCARFADLCQYFRQQDMDLPTQIVEEVRVVSKLPVKERIARIKHFNRDLMEYLNDVGPDSHIRQ